MANSFVGSYASTHAIASAQSIALSNLKDASNATPTLQQRDLIIVVVNVTGTTDVTQANLLPSGYTAMHTDLYADDTNDTNLQVGYKFMGASPDTTVSIPAATSTVNGVAYSIYAFRGVDIDTPMDVTTTTVTGTNGGVPNAPAITPSTAGTWLFIVGASAMAAGVAVTAPSSGVSTTTNHSRNAVITSTTVDAAVSCCIKTDWSSGSFDPATFGGGTSTNTGSNAAVTIALRPQNAPTITSSATPSVSENVTLAHTLTSNQTVTWSIPSGTDSAKFEISGSTLRWAANGTKNFESPDDANADNVYLVTVRATNSNSTLTTDQNISVTVTDAGPVITSANTNTVGEGLVLAHTLTATGGSPTWSIVGGADQSKFEISGSTLRWLSNGTKDFWAPDDANTDNAYIVTVRATISGETQDQTITITVFNTKPQYRYDFDSYANGATFENSVAGKWSRTAGIGSLLVTAGSPKTLTASHASGISVLEFSEVLTQTNGDTGFLEVDYTTASYIGTPVVGFRICWSNSTTYYQVQITSTGALQVQRLRTSQSTLTMRAGSASDFGLSAKIGLKWYINGSSQRVIEVYKDRVLFYSVTDTDSSLGGPITGGGERRLRIADSNTISMVINTLRSDLNPLAPNITSTATDTVNENAVLAKALTTSSGGGAWSLVGGADQARFQISGSTLQWLSNGTKNFESPNDADTNNSYVVTVRNTENGFIGDQTITVTVLNVAQPSALSWGNFARSKTGSAVADQADQTTGWGSPSAANIATIDSVYNQYTAQLTSVNTTGSKLFITGFDYSAANLFPSDVALTGFQVDIRRNNAEALSGASAGVLSAQLLLNGTPVGNVKTSTWVSGSITLGTSSTDMWGTTITLADLIAGNVGISVWGAYSSADITPQIDRVSLTSWHSGSPLAANNLSSGSTVASVSKTYDSRYSIAGGTHSGEFELFDNFSLLGVRTTTSPLTTGISSIQILDETAGLSGSEEARTTTLNIEVYSLATETVYVGSQSMATVKLGPSAESTLYVGAKDLFP